jgi:hypothetical protein
MEIKNISELIDESLALVTNNYNQYNKKLEKPKPEPKFSGAFLDDTMCMERIKAFVEYVRQHHPVVFEDAYKQADKCFVDNE